jgi:ABC-type Zn uptake system ZnuABC Zn-binding protein ZnuA
MKSMITTGKMSMMKITTNMPALIPHIWLSPPLVKIQARTILAALQEADPAHRSVYEANFKAFTAQIDQLDADLKKTFAGKRACNSWYSIRPGDILPMPMG